MPAFTFKNMYISYFLSGGILQHIVNLHSCLQTEFLNVESFLWATHSHFSLSCIGQGNGNSLQCSCLENPRDGGTWWAAFYGVTQSQTRLKWLSSSRKRWKSLDYALADSAFNGMNMSCVSHSPDWLTDWQYAFFLYFFFSVLLCPFSHFALWDFHPNKLSASKFLIQVLLWRKT